MRLYGQMRSLSQKTILQQFVNLQDGFHLEMCEPCKHIYHNLLIKVCFKFFKCKLCFYFFLFVVFVLFCCLLLTLDKASTDSIVCSNMLKNLTNPTGPKLNKDPNSHKLSDWYSLFPVENSKLVYEKWEDKIIWDNEAVDTMPKPEVFKLDPNDENLILSLPEDVEAKQQSEQEEQLTKKEYKSKSRFMNKKNQDQTEEVT